MKKHCFLDVKTCLKLFYGVFSVFFAWEKSMLSTWGFLTVAVPDERHCISFNVDGVESLD